MKWDFTFRHDRIHFWGTNFLTVYIDSDIWHFEPRWPASRWIIKLWTIAIFFFFFMLCEIFPFIVLSFCLHLDCCCHWSASNWVFFFTQLSSVDFLNLCSSSSYVRTCRRQWWLVSAPECYLWRNMWVTSILRQLRTLIIPYILFWTWQELYFQNFYLNLQYFQQRFHSLLVTCSVTVAWGITTLLRLQCCVACGSFSSVNCGKNIYSISIAVNQTTTELSTQGNMT
jgi:hypothetical protein